MTKMTQLRRTVLTCFVRVCLLSLQSFLETTDSKNAQKHITTARSDLLRLQQKLMKLKQLQEQQHLQAQGSPESQAQKWTHMDTSLYRYMYDNV